MARFLGRPRALCDGGFGQIVRRRAVILTAAQACRAAARAARWNGSGEIVPDLIGLNGRVRVSASTDHFYRFFAGRMSVAIKLKVLLRRRRSDAGSDEHFHP